MLSKPVVLPIGTLGTGKSTVLNRILGLSIEETDLPDGFKTSDEPEGCTQDFSFRQLEQATLIDTPGLNDPRMPLGIWLNSLKKVGGKEVSLCLMFIMQKHRPDALDKTNFLVMMEAIKGIEPSNIAVVFTHCDENTSYTKEKGLKYLNSLITQMEKDQCKVPYTPSADNIFLFKGDGDQPTTRDELVTWLYSILPEKNCEINVDADLNKLLMEGGGDKHVKELLASQVKQTQEYEEKIAALTTQITTVQNEMTQQKEINSQLQSAFANASRSPEIVYVDKPYPVRSGCFAKGTVLLKVVDKDVIETKIEDIKEDDYVLAQHQDGSIKPELVGILDTHAGKYEVLKLTLSSGQEISITPNHGMLVYEEGDLASATNRSQLVYARNIQVGMKFRNLASYQKQGFKSSDSLDLVEVVDIKEDVSDDVFNVVGYHFNVVANNVVVSSYTEDTKGIPQVAFSVGKLIHNWIGVNASRKYYRAFN